MDELKEKLLQEIEQDMKRLPLPALNNFKKCIKLISHHAFKKHEQAELSLIHHFTNYYYKDYRAPQSQAVKKIHKTGIHLPLPHETLPEKLTDVLKNRRSRREFIHKNIPIKTFSTLLFYSYGKTGLFKTSTGESESHQTAPSAGALFPTELFTVVHYVERLKPGLYKYLPENHQLEFQSDEDYRKKIVTAGLEQSFLGESSAVFLLTAFPDKIFPKYGLRSYRYILLDAGHIAQNIYLTAEALNLGVCEVGAFYDDYLNELFDFDGEKTFIVSLLAVGNTRNSKI